MTNALSVLNQCDHVVYLEDGCIVESGSFDELCAHNGPFASFLYSKQTDPETSVEPENNNLRKYVLIQPTSRLLDLKLAEKTQGPGERDAPFGAVARDVAPAKACRQ